MARNSEMAKKTNERLETISSGGEDKNMMGEEVKEDRKKKRKLWKAKGLRLYTKRKGEEGKFKGWSPRALLYMAKLVQEMKEN
jgi:hypothetical protein